jgi:hypothetical protein
MRALIMLMMFAGLAMVIHSVYEEKLQRAMKQAKVEYRFLPRTMYEDQMAHTDLLNNFRTMFDHGPESRQSIGLV